MMKKLLLLAAVAVAGLSACNKQKCPAYTSTKAANRVSSPITALAVDGAATARQ